MSEEKSYFQDHSNDKLESIEEKEPKQLEDLTKESNERIETATQSIPEGVLYQPGKEPLEIRKKIINLFEKLDEAYPDKVIISLHKDHRKWGEKVTELYRILRYPDGNSFLKAYGYSVEISPTGRPSKIDPHAVIAQLKNLYPEGTSMSLSELQKAHPDIPWKSLQNKSNEYFGMTLSKYLASEGILTSKEAIEPIMFVDEKQVTDFVETLKSRYEGKSKPTNLKTLIAENPDLSILEFQKFVKQKLGISIEEYLTKNGVIDSDKGGSDKDKLDTIVTTLLERYKGKEMLPKNVLQIQYQNQDLKLSNINNLVKKVKGVSAKEYFTTLGILAVEKTFEGKLEDIMSVLKERYIGTEKKALSITDLKIQNPDLDILSLYSLIKKVYDMRLEDYLYSIGVLIDPARLEEERRNAQKAVERAKFKNDLPFEELYETYLDLYNKQTIENPFFDIEIPEEVKEEVFSSNRFQSNNKTTERTPDGFVIEHEFLSGHSEYELVGYEGDAEIVEIPDYVTCISNNNIFTNDNIKKIVSPKNLEKIWYLPISESVRKKIADENGLCIIGRFLIDYFGHEESVTIPEGVEIIAREAFRENTSIKTVYLPKSIKEIGPLAFWRCSELSEIVFSGEKIDLIDWNAFSGCSSLKIHKWPKLIKAVGMEAFDGCNLPKINGEFEVVSNVLVRYCGTNTVVNVPEGITIIGPDAFKEEQIVKIVLPDGVKIICQDAFSRMKSLREVLIPESVETIESGAFDFCDQLLSIDLRGVIKIGYGAFKCCEGLKEVILGEKLEAIGHEAFTDCYNLISVRVQKANGAEKTDQLKNNKECSFSPLYGCEPLEEISVPGSVRKIGIKAFSYCTKLRKLVLEEGIEEIGDSAFEYTSSMISINIPLSVKTIGKNAFYYCNCSKEIVLPEAFCDKKYYLGIPDQNNCLIENKTLVSCVFTKEKVIHITDGVVVLGKYSLGSICYHSTDISQVILPDSVRVIRHENYGYKPNFKMNIPCGYLLQKCKLPVKPLKNLLNSFWKDEATMLDWVSIFLYQNKKDFYENCLEAFSKAPNAFVICALTILGQGGKSKDILKIAEVIFDLRKDIGQEFLDKYYLFAKEYKSKETVAILAPYVSTSCGGQLNVKKEYKNDLEEFCDKNYENHELDRFMDNSGIPEVLDYLFQKSKVKYLDSDEMVSDFVLKCAILPYIGQLTEKPRNISAYKKDFSKFIILDNCEKIVSNFEKSSFDAFIEEFEKVVSFENTYYNPQLWIPLCRFGTGNLVKHLITRMNNWSHWNTYAARGRSAIMVCRGAIMLNDSREAIMYAEKCKLTDYYAQIRGTTADIIRDTKLADFGFDEDGKKIYDLGSTIIEASIGNDLTIRLFDTKASKTVKSLPKRGSDKEKYAVCAADYSELKRNVKKVVKSRNNMLFEYFLNGSTFKSLDWITSYTKNPVLHQVAKLLVWAQGKNTFTLTDTGAIDSLGNDYLIRPQNRIKLAHPLEMNDADILRWQKYFTERELKQPFAQIWEGKINGEIQKDRYKGCLIPYYRFLHQENHGIWVNDYNFHEEIDISMTGCSAIIERRDYSGRHNIEVNDRFEIVSFVIHGLNRKTNHLINYLDQCVIFKKIEEDDESAIQNLDGYTVAQIDSFLKFAIEKGSTKCTAVFLNYKNDHYSDFADVEEFTLDF